MFFQLFGDEIVDFARDRNRFVGFGLLDPRRIEREHLHVDPGGIHFRNAAVADVAQLIVEFRATGIPHPFRELLARTGEKRRADEMLFEGNGSHHRSVQLPYYKCPAYGTGQLRVRL